MSMETSQIRRRGFSLLELVVVVVIVGVIAAIAISRVSRGAAGAEESALRRDLQLLNNALEHYWAEHMSTYPDPGDIESQLTLYSDITGSQLAGGRDAARGIIYGPYLRQVPPVPMGPNKGSSRIAVLNGAGVGWIYDTSENRIVANLDEPIKIVVTGEIILARPG